MICLLVFLRRRDWMSCGVASPESARRSMVRCGSYMYLTLKKGPLHLVHELMQNMAAS